LVRCKEGARLAHEWSKAHPKYNPAEADAKLKQAMDKAGPRTCESIKADFGTHCNDCAARVKSPIVLGRVDRLPEGFQARENGIYFRTEDKDGNPEWHWLCSPLKVLALTREGDNQEWGRLVEVRDPDGNAHRWAMPMRSLRGSGDDLRGELMAMGLCLAPGKGPARLHQFLSLCRPRGRVRCVPRIGWHGRRFILHDAVFGFEAGESVILQAERVDNPFKIMGTLSDWQEHVGRFCVGNTRLVLSVSAAFAAPLLYLSGAESGGLHLVGGSSLGKTTALVVAGSVCGGGGVRGYILQWRATANGLEGVAASHCDALLCLDELSQVTPQAAGETAYMLTNETGKTRATKQGTARKPAEWRVLFLSTGEITLADKIREDGKTRAMAGQLVRVVDIYADAGVGLGIFEDLHGFPDGDTFSRHLKDAAKRAYGVALRAFLERLTADHDDAMRVVPALIKTFMADYCPAGADGQVKRVCARFGLVAAGGECGAAYGVLPWPEGEATQAAARCFRDWLALRGGTGASEIQAGLAQVRAFFQAHGSSRFETWGDRADESKTINRAGFRRKDDLTGAWEYYTPAAVFKSEIARGHDAGRVVKELVERGLIILGTDGKPASGHRIPGQPFTRYYHFASSIVSEDSDLLKNTVAWVAPVASSNDAGSSRYRPETARVAPVAPDDCNPKPATAATPTETEGLQKKGNDYDYATAATAATHENDNPGQKAPSVIDMTPAAGTKLWTGPAEVEL
jgi:putative DNA primase/helicase